MSADTSPEQSRRYHALLRARPLAERAAALQGLCDAVRALAEAGIRQRHPGASPEEVRQRLVVRLYGREAALRLFGRVPEGAR